MNTRLSPYRAQVLVLHLLELGISIASTQLNISQHHLEHCVVDGLCEVHMQLVHGSLQGETSTPLQNPFWQDVTCQREKTNRNEKNCILHILCYFKFFCRHRMLAKYCGTRENEDSYLP